MTNSEISVIKILRSDFENSWMVCSGRTIDLFLGRKTRDHKDIDLFNLLYKI